MSSPPVTWPQASRELARRVARRERWGTVLRPAGWLLTIAAASTLALKVLGIGGWVPLACVGACLVALLLAAWGRGGRAAPVEESDAAWALDRLAGARGRGLAAATVEGPAGGEAAWGPGRIDPPAVRLLPPRGLALFLAGLLLLAVAAVVPARSAPDEVGGAPATLESAPAGGSAPATSLSNLVGLERSATSDAKRADAAAAMREALGLTPGAARDPERVAERLRNDELRRAARAAATEGDPLGALLQAGDEESARQLARALGEGEEAGQRAREARRQAARLRAEAAVPSIPAERRALLERYFARLGVSFPADDGAR